MGRGPGMMRGAGGAVEKARNSRATLGRLAAYLRPQALNLTVVMVLVVLNTGLELLGPLLLGVAIDRFIGPRDLDGLLRISLLLLASYAAAWFTQFGQSYTIVAVTQNVLRALRRDLFEHLQTLSLRFFDRRSTGELMSRLTNDIDAINRVLSQSIIDLVASLLTLAGIAIVMLALNAWLALGALAILPIMLWLTARVGGGTRRGFRQVQANLGKLNMVMEENISGARVVQAFRRQGAIIAEFDQANVAARDATIRAQSLMMILRPLLMVFGNIDIAIIAGLGGWLALQGLVSVGVIATFILYARRFFEPLFTLADLYNSIQSALAGAERVFEILDQQPTVRDRPDAVALDRFAGRVAFDHVSFAYEPNVPVLKDVSLSLEPGQVVALVGPTGAGKTTIVSLLTRFYDIDEGSIWIDGHEIRDLEQDSLRRQLGIVLQDNFLFSATALENIRYGRLEASEEECIAAARLANADQFIRRLPEGYQTRLSERASNLSQGQRQLLAIARALLADPRILILDEATSNVDTRTESQLQEALRTLMAGRTSFVIAHRLSTIRNADLVLVIDNGRIIERGTHDSLMAQRGFYHHLYMSQFKGQTAQACPE
ncbi:MAG: ABC transporter ATP-binding protein [Chloroflexi bacterium]|nr:ABC transporter ATP-binding protein [Chloroflexota bacterium]